MYEACAGNGGSGRGSGAAKECNAMKQSIIKMILQKRHDHIIILCFETPEHVNVVVESVYKSIKIFISLYSL